MSFVGTFGSHFLCEAFVHVNVLVQIHEQAINLGKKVVQLGLREHKYIYFHSEYLKVCFVCISCDVNFADGLESEDWLGFVIISIVMDCCACYKFILSIAR